MHSALYAIARPSIRLSARVDQSKSVDVTIMQLSPKMSNKGGVEKTSYFLALYVDISKTVRDTTKVTAISTNDRKLVAYALSIGTKVDDLG